MRYTGQQSDPESGLYYLRARYYDPTTGRFLTVDPKPALNLYIYADNRPTASADPSGMGTGMENPYARAPWWAGLLMGAGIPLAAMGGAYAVGVVAEAGPAIVSKLMAPAAGGIGVAKAFVSKAQLQQIAQKVDTAGAVLDRKRVYYNTSNLTGETCTNEILNWKRGDEIIGTIHRVYDAAGTLIHEDWDAALVNGTFYLPK
ncbi:MAG: RHS repeat-associated core domain-containing protein [Chloroflexi bacterium]|nr:RHS repeat-associated core domain-containing protein [Chloroflexota bacterium]